MSEYIGQHFFLAQKVVRKCERASHELILEVENTLNLNDQMVTLRDQFEWLDKDLTKHVLESEKEVRFEGLPHTDGDLVFTKQTDRTFSALNSL